MTMITEGINFIIQIRKPGQQGPLDKASIGGSRCLGGVNTPCPSVISAKAFFLEEVN
jgi:hypothetical protein